MLGIHYSQRGGSRYRIGSALGCNRWVRGSNPAADPDRLGLILDGRLILCLTHCILPGPHNFNHQFIFYEPLSSSRINQILCQDLSLCFENIMPVIWTFFQVKNAYFYTFSHIGQVYSLISITQKAFKGSLREIWRRIGNHKWYIKMPWKLS